MAGVKADVYDGSEVSPSQAVALVGAPTFPNCIKFSETNLLAVASGHLVTILDPAALSGPRGFIPVATSSLFDVGNVEQEGLQAGPLLPYILFRDPRPGVRSMDWSPSGLAQNGGCLLAVCTTDNRVKVYREPFSDFQSDWVEIEDLSEMAYKYCVENDFRECELVSAQIAMQDATMPPPSDWGLPVKRKHGEEHEEVEEPQHRKMRKRNHGITTKGLGEKDLIPVAGDLQELPSDIPAQLSETIQPSFGQASGGMKAVTLASTESGRTSPEQALVLHNTLETATLLEANAGVHSRVRGSISEISDGEAFRTHDEPRAGLIFQKKSISVTDLEKQACISKHGHPTVDEFSARVISNGSGHKCIYSASNSNIGGQECYNEAGDAARSVLTDDHHNERLASVPARSHVSLKVYARKRGAFGRSLAMGSSFLMSANPVADTCGVGNASGRTGGMRRVGDAGLLKFLELVDSGEPIPLPSSVKHRRRLKSQPEDRIKIAADYVARTELLSPLAIAWSPKCQAAERVDEVEVNKRHSFALLGAGTKSGRVSIWRMMYPSCYSIDHVHRPVEASFLGFLDAHKSWVTSLCWASCNFDLAKVNMVLPVNLVGGSSEKLLLVTGCSDGSVKIWAARSDSLISASSKQTLPVAFCKQVGKADSVPVTSLALVVLFQPSDRALLAVGKGSGSLTIYEITSSGVCHQLCYEDGAHQQTITGLSWKFDGRCLYSCGQDSLKIWELFDAGLKCVKFPDWSGVFPVIISPDLCSADAMESFFGVALSHSCLALATVRDLDSDVLDQMYQARSQKAVVQMFWLGIKPTEVARNVGSTSVSKGMTVEEIDGWKVNILTALQHLEDPKKALVLWDVVAALSLLREAVGGEVVVTVLSEWLMGWTRGEDALGAVEPAERPARHFERAVPEASCRQLHILNVICRRLLLVHLKAEVMNTSPCKTIPPSQTSCTVTRDEKLWGKCIYLVEHELRQRLVHLRLCKATYKEEELERFQNVSSGILLNVKWVFDNSTSVSPELSKVASQLRKSHRNLLRSLSETCPLCESTVALDSPETASCQGTGSGGNRHHLQRCSVSMELCPPVCQWYCSCCQRRATEHAPSLFFGLSSRSRVHVGASHALLQSDTYAGCPFCGLLMHRLLPNFFLTPSLV